MVLDECFTYDIHLKALLCPKNDFEQSFGLYLPKKHEKRFIMMFSKRTKKNLYSEYFIRNNKVFFPDESSSQPSKLLLRCNV